jgi:hypothetical protein
MKIIVSFMLVGVLSGCATVDKVKELWPRDHDSAMVAGYVDLQQKLNAVDCSDKNTVNEAIFRADWLNKYVYFREDPQRVTTNTIVQNLNKAAAAEVAACKRWINLANINMKTLQKSWGAR